MPCGPFGTAIVPTCRSVTVSSTETTLSLKMPTYAFGSGTLSTTATGAGADADADVGTTVDDTGRVDATVRADRPRVVCACTFAEDRVIARPGAGVVLRSAKTRSVPPIRDTQQLSRMEDLRFVTAAWQSLTNTPRRLIRIAKREIVRGVTRPPI